jgi:tetratricopeptide (TPR) repeat protein
MSSLSKSLLWSKLEEYYNNIGPEAWSDEVVPMQISTNKSLALAYANIILGHINDWFAANKEITTEPFHIIEIGAGHGKFSFYIVKALEELFQIYNYPINLIKYIITDIAPKNVASWSNHPALKPYIDSGIMDTAEFNAISDNTINLLHSKKVITKNSLAKPIFAIGNYIFDSLAHDAFQIRDHKLFEATIKISGDDNWQDFFDNASFEFEHNAIKVPTSEFDVDMVDYYQDKNLNKILTDYKEHFSEASIIIPLGGVMCVNMLQTFTSAPVVLLLADKGLADIALFEGLDDPDITAHGSISMMVNFDALARYFTYSNGTALLMPNRTADFQVAVFVTHHNYPIYNTKHNFTQGFSGASPQDLINLCYNEDDIKTNFSNLDEALAILNINHWDLGIFYDLHDTILELIEDTEVTLEQDKCLKDNLTNAWQYFFKLEKNADLPFAIGMVFYALDDYENANYFYELSIKEFGANSENSYNLAISLQMLDRIEESKKFAQQALSFDPKYKLAKELLTELQ